MRFLVVFTSALVLEIGSTFYINSVANLDLNRMILWSFLGPFIALPFSGFIADERRWSVRIYFTLFSSLGYAVGAYISANIIA